MQRVDPHDLGDEIVDWMLNSASGYVKPGLKMAWHARLGGPIELRPSGQGPNTSEPLQQQTLFFNVRKMFFNEQKRKHVRGSKH